MDKNKKTYCLLPYLKETEKAVILTLKVVTREGDSIRNPLYDRFDDVALQCYIRDDGYSGVEVGYMNRYFVDAHACRLMAKTLSDLERKLNRMNKEMGYTMPGIPELGRFCKALDITYIVHAVNDKGAFYSDNEYRFLDIPCGLNWLETHVQKFCETHQAGLCSIKA